MAYNNYSPMAYPNYYPQYPQPQRQPIWIQGEAAAKSYLVAPNNTVILFDTESPTIYIKSADETGLPTTKILDYTIRDTTPTTGAAFKTNDYVTREELDAFEKKISEQIESMKGAYDE